MPQVTTCVSLIHEYPGWNFPASLQPGGSARGSRFTGARIASILKQADARAPNVRCARLDRRSVPSAWPTPSIVGRCTSKSTRRSLHGDRRTSSSRSGTITGSCRRRGFADDGLEFLGEAFVQRAKTNGTARPCAQPGKPNRNGCVQRCNRGFREALLDQHLFLRLEEVCEVIC